jgi:hypothetical protein
MHIFVGSLSVVSGISVNLAIKLVASAIIGIVPLMTYFATNRVFKPSIQKYIVVASGLPTFISYSLVGATFGVTLYFCVMCLILRTLLIESKRQDVVVLVILAFGLLFSHAIITVLLLKLLTIRKTWVLKGWQNARVTVMGILLILIISYAARLTFGSGNVLETLTGAAESILMSRDTGVVPGTFFLVPFSAKISFLVLSYIKDAVIVLMSAMGLVVLLTKLRHKYREIYEKFYPFLLCFMSAILALMAFQLLSGFSGTGYQRFIDYAIVMSPFIVGPFLWHLRKNFNHYRFGSGIIAIVLFSCISVSLIQIFPFQPIAPKANALSPNLPMNEYIFDFRSVNTVYQEKMILFAERFSSNGSMVALDTVTRWQARGFANDAFNYKLVNDDPLTVQNVSWDLFLLHYDGKAGPLNEKVENRTSERLSELKNTLDVLYDNGESFIMAQ